MTNNDKNIKCIHRWFIEPPNGAKSKGVCMDCGEEKFFSNYIHSDHNPFVSKSRRSRNE